MNIKGAAKKIYFSSLILGLTACGGGGGSSTSAPEIAPAPIPPPAMSGALFSVPAPEFLTIQNVEQIIAQGVAEAQAQNVNAVFAVVDRPGNVLAVFNMNGAPATTVLQSGQTTNTGLQGVEVPATLAAISKAITGAYLSSAGNAFSTRTASMIVQEHFPPSQNTVGLESGPLFGVQFSQLPCSDFSERFGTTIGPKRAPLGLAADPGGFPLYKNGIVVGGIGVSADNIYGFDPEVTDIDSSVEELIAIAAMANFSAPQSIRADRISVDGTTLRFTDMDESDLLAGAGQANAFASLLGTSGALSAVTGYNTANIIAGQAYGTESSGIRAATNSEYSNPDVFVMTDGNGVNRFPPRAGADGVDVTTPLTQTEVQALLEEAFDIMSDARAQIRQPLESRAQVTISVVDTHGTILGMVRSPDAPIFGSDVSLQKARTATFFSNAVAANDLLGTLQNPALAGPNILDPRVNDRVQTVRDFLSDPNALTGAVAFADRSGGNLSRPFFPDGEVGTLNGPLSEPIENFSPFATGLQENLIFGNVAQHVGFVASMGAPSSDTRQRCTFIPDATLGQNRLQNGIQIFPGSVPVYRDNELIGGIGVSGDGIDQDDMIAFLGLHNAGIRLGTINNAPEAIRADNITVEVNGDDIRLRYVSCPFAPFLSTNEQNPCAGK